MATWLDGSSYGDAWVPRVGECVKLITYATVSRVHGDGIHYSVSGLDLEAMPASMLHKLDSHEIPFLNCLEV